MMLMCLQYIMVQKYQSICYARRLEIYRSPGGDYPRKINTHREGCNKYARINICCRMSWDDGMEINNACERKDVF